MSTITLYPAVDIKDGKAVRLIQGKADAQTIYDDDPVQASLRFSKAGSEWIHVVDLDAAFTGNPKNRHLVKDIIEATGAKVQASGGIRSLEDLNAAIGFGASRVVIGTMALEDPDFVKAALDAHGDKVAVGLDASGRTLRSRGWTEDSGDLFDALELFTNMGVARFVYTDIARDGMMQGPNVEWLLKVANATSAHVTASGGVATLDDLRTLRDVHDRVDAAIVGKALYAKAFTIDEALQVCRNQA